MESDLSAATGRYAERLLAVAAAVAILVFLFIGLQRPVFLDEANSVIIAGRGFSGVLDSLSRDNNLPLYYVILSAWMRLFGDSETALRLLSGLFYLGGCLAAFALTKRLTRNHRAAWYGALFYEASALAIRNGQNIRMYAMLGMLSGLSALAFLRLFRDRDRSWKSWAFFLGVNAAGIFTHVWFAFALAAQFLALAIFDRRETPRFAAGAAVSGLPFAALWGGRFLGQLHNGATDWMPKLNAALVLNVPLELYGPLAACAVYALAAGVWLTAGSRRALPKSGIGLLLMVATASLAVPLLVSTVRPIYWPGRYTIIAVAPLAAVFGALFALLPPRVFAAVAGLALIGFQAAGHIAARDAYPEAQLPPGQSDRTTAQFLLARAAPGDAIVFTSLTRASADYYFNRAGAFRRYAEYSFPAEVATHLGWDDPAFPLSSLEHEADALVPQLAARAATGAKVWVYDGFSPQATRILKQKLEARLTLLQRHELQGAYHKRILEYGAASALAQ